MIDKLELRAKPEIPFTSEFEAVYRKSRERAKETDYYREVIDLRPYGTTAILHTRSKFNANRKLELIGAGTMSFCQMEAEVRRVYDWPAGELELMRVDFTADIPGIRSEWFWTHARARNKRCAELIEGSEVVGTGTTLHFGQHPDCYRIYDKAAQIRSRLGSKRAEKELRRLIPKVACLSEEVVVTRVEHQLSGRSIPIQLSTFEALQMNAAEFNPFRSLVLFAGGERHLVRGEYKPRLYREGRGFRLLIEEEGLALAWKEEQLHGNAKRTFRRLAPFIPPDPENFQPLDLRSSYQESLRIQMSSAQEPQNSPTERLIVFGNKL